MYTVPAAACSMAVLYICTSCCMFHDCPISVPAAACSTTVFYVCTSCYMFQGCSLYLYQLLHVPGLFSLTVPAAACSMTVLYVCTVYCTWLSSVTVTDDVPWLSFLQYVVKEMFLDCSQYRYMWRMMFIVQLLFSLFFWKQYFIATLNFSSIFPVYWAFFPQLRWGFCRWGECLFNPYLWPTLPTGLIPPPYTCSISYTQLQHCCSVPLINPYLWLTVLIPPPDTCSISYPCSCDIVVVFF